MPSDLKNQSFLHMLLSVVIISGIFWEISERGGARLMRGHKAGNLGGVVKIGSQGLSPRCGKKGRSQLPGHCTNHAPTRRADPGEHWVFVLIRDPEDGPDYQESQNSVWYKSVQEKSLGMVPIYKISDSIRYLTSIFI